MSTTTGLSFASRASCGVVVDLVLLRGDEQEIHLARLGAAAEHLVVDGTTLMSNGMCCSASQWICSSSSPAVIIGTVIFRMMTDWP